MSIGRPGVSTKSKALSCGSWSLPARTVPFMLASATVNGAKTTDEDAFGATPTGCVSIVRPSISSVTGRSLIAIGPRLMIPVVTATRSWPEKVVRVKVTEGTERFGASADATETGVRTVPSAKCTSSAPVHPDF
jgi:hypothetical protein